MSSIIEGLLLEGVLDTVARSDVYIAIRDDGAVGTGTRDDPYDGSTAARFDDVMQNKVGGGVTIHLGPTKKNGQTEKPFLTAGTAVWKSKSGQRIVGAGMFLTTLQLVPTPGSHVVAVGNNASTDYLYGFEISDLTIDCNLSAAASAITGAIKLTGRRIRVDRVRAVGWGSNDSTGTCAVISTARASGANPLPPFDCIIADCIVETPSSAHNGKAIGIELHGQETTIYEDEFVVFGVMGHRLSDFVLWEQEAESALKMAYHEGCVIRNCLVDGGGIAKDVRGMSVSGGLGSILERNRLRNCRYGISIESVVSSPNPAIYSNKDVVLWDNYINNVRHGIQVVTSSAHKVGRVIMERNTVLLANDGTPTGIEVKVTGTPEWAIEQCIVRHNVVRSATGVPDGTLGISLDYCERAVVHNNVVSVPVTDNAVRVRMTTGAKGTVFNNRTPSAGFLPVYDPETSRHLFEFTTDVEERLIAV